MRRHTLYKRTTTGSVQEWTIEVQNNRYRTISGKVGGKMVTSEWTEVDGKNAGRSNETTPSEQAQLAYERKIQRQIEKGYRAKVDAIDTGLNFKPMLADKVKDVKTLTFPVLAQPKLDGIRCIARKDGLWSRNAKPILSAPHIWAEINSTGIWDTYPDAVIDGELYNHELKDKFEKIISLARKSKPSKADLRESEELIEYHVYDGYLTKHSSKWGWFARMNKVVEHVMDLPSIRHVPTHICYDVDSLDSLYGKWLEEGYEGQMIRLIDNPYENKRTKGLLKRKEFLDGEFEIIDVIEGQGNRSNMAGRVRCKMSDGTEFQAGIKGGEALYIKMLKERGELIGKKATIRYQNLSEYGVPRFPVCTSIRDYE